MESTSTNPNDARVQIRINLRSKEIKNEEVDCADGCLIYCEKHSCEHAPLRKRIELEYVGDETHKKELTNRALMGMANGILLEYDRKDECLYAKRRCNTVIFCHSSQYHDNENPAKMQRDQRVKIFDYKTFRLQFIEWLTRNIDGGDVEPFKLHKIFFSFGQKWQPYLECHKELGDQRPQPTSLDSCLISMTAVPLGAQEMVMSMEEGRKCAKTISMGLNQHFFFVSIEGSTEICNSLERIRQNVRQIKETEEKRKQNASQKAQYDYSDGSEANMMEQSFNIDKILSDCLDLHQSIEARRNEVLKNQNDVIQSMQVNQIQTTEHQMVGQFNQAQLADPQQPHQQQMMNYQQPINPHLPMDSHQLMNPHLPMDSHPLMNLQQPIHQQQLIEQSEPVNSQTLINAHQPLNHPASEYQYPDCYMHQHSQNKTTPEQELQNYQANANTNPDVAAGYLQSPCLRQRRPKKMGADFQCTSRSPSLRLRPQQKPSPSTAHVNFPCQVTRDRTVYFNWGEGTTDQVAMTSEEFTKLVGVIEKENLLKELGF